MIENCTNNVNIIITGEYYCGGIVADNQGIIYRCINNSGISSKHQAAGGIAGENGCGGAIGFIIECINNGKISSDSWTAGGITATCGNFGTDAKSYICNSYNTGTVSGGVNRRAGIAGQVKYKGGNTYIYNCYNRGDIIGCPDIIGYDGGAGSCINLNSYGASEATIEKLVEKLNVESDIEQGLKDTKLYRSNAWTLKDGQIALDWEK